MEGPNEITIFTPEAISPIHGPDSLCTRAAWYDNIMPIFSVATVRSKAVHDSRRRVWDQAFSIKALRTHEATVLKHADELKTAISVREGQELNITEWVQRYGFDVMGDVQFNHPFHMLQKEDEHWVIDMVKQGNLILGYMTSLPWLIRVAQSLPFLGSKTNFFKSWAASIVSHRMQQKPAKADTINWLLKHAEDTDGIKADWMGLVGDTMGMVLGGTEPVITAMAFMFYYLATSPERVAKLRSEIRTLTSYCDTVQLSALPYLNGLIYETYRLQPGVPSGGLRTTPPSGLMITDRFIPGNTTVLTPHYSLHRREDCFERAAEFIPERWTTHPEMIKDRRAFMPWGIGEFTPSLEFSTSN